MCVHFKLSFYYLTASRISGQLSPSLSWQVLVLILRRCICVVGRHTVANVMLDIMSKTSLCFQVSTHALEKFFIKETAVSSGV